MDIETLVNAAGKHGALGSAMPDIIRRGKEHFGDTDPTPEQLTGWLDAQKTEAGHLFTPPPPDVPADVRLSAEEKLTRGRSPGPEKYRAPVPDKAMQAELTAIVSPTQRLTAYRAWQAQQGQGHGG